MERTLGRAVRAQRLQRQWTQPMLAEHSGVPQNTISRIESDQQKPTLDNLVALARAFDMTVDGLLQEAGIDQPATQRLLASAESELAQLWHTLDADDRETVMRVARGLARCADSS